MRAAHRWTVPNGPRTQQDTKMKLIFLLTAILALSLAESEHEKKHYDDLIAAESIELHKDLKPEASEYTSVPYPSWNKPQYIPPQTYPPQTYPPQTYPPQKYPAQTYPPQQQWPKPPAVPANPPSNPPSYVPGFGSVPPQSDYVPPHHHYTTTPVPVIKNEQYFGDNGSYKYEYQIADGTWVGEEGWFTDPKKTEESLVKKGWYQYIGRDGKTYTVTYWADHTGYHAFGDHLPTAGPVPKATHKSIDQNAREEAAKAEAEKNKPYYPPTQKPIYYDAPQTQAPYYPSQQPNYPPPQPYYPPQQTYYPPQANYPSGK